MLSVTGLQEAATVKALLNQMSGEAPEFRKSQETNLAIREKLQYLARSYKLNPIFVEYSDWVTCYAYMYKYMAHHANATYKMLRRTQAYKWWKGSTISYLGGGPGSDFLGTVSYLAEHGLVSALKVQNIDRASAWQPFWECTCHNLDGIGGMKLLPSFKNMALDDPCLDDCVRTSQVIMMSHVIAENTPTISIVQQRFEHIVRSAQTNTVFILVDREVGSPLAIADACVQRRELVEVYRDVFIPYLDDRDVLTHYHFQYGQSPLGSKQVAYRILEKR